MAWDWNGIDVTVEIAFATDPLATTPTWTDVSDYVRSIPRIFRGKTSEDVSISPASAILVFGNRDRRFDPDYASSPYSPNVKPMKRLRIAVAKGAFSATVFTGFVTSWRNEWTADRDGVSVVTCVDSTWWIANEPLSASAYEVEVLADSPIHYWPMQTLDALDDLATGEAQYAMTAVPLVDMAADALGLTPGRIQGNGMPTSVEMARPIGASAGVADCMARTSTGLSAQPVALEFWWDLATADFADQWLLVRAQAEDPADLAYLVVTRTSANDGAIAVAYGDPGTNQRAFLTSTGWWIGRGVHHVVAYVSGASLFLRVDGKTIGSVALTAGTSSVGSEGAYSQAVSFSQTTDVTGSGVSHVAVYSTAPSTSRFDQHYRVGLDAWGHPHGEKSGTRIGRVLDEIGWSASLRSIDTGATIQGPYLPAGQLAIDYINSVVASERGLLFVDRSGAIAFHDRIAMTDGSLDTGYVLSDDGAAGAVQYERLDMEPSTVDTVRNIVTFSYSDVGAITREDQTSIDDYGASSLSVDGPTIPKARVASALAAFELAQRKDPATRVASVRCAIRQPTDTQTTTQTEKLLDLELGDIVDVEVTPVGVTPQVVKTVQVLGIEHQIELDQWYVTLYMSPAYTQTGWFTLGTSSLGGADILLP